MNAEISGCTETAQSATGERNLDGQAIAITVFSTIRPWGNVIAPIPGRIFLPILFVVTRRIPKLTVTLRQLSFIHFARWTVITKLPYNGAPQAKQRFRYPHMYFESNFNGGWEEYIDAFSHILTKGMTAFWGSSYGFPRPLPTAQFKQYINANETEVYAVALLGGCILLWVGNEAGIVIQSGENLTKHFRPARIGAHA